jgi:hypothetical protein
MVVDADTVEARVFAAGDEIGDSGQRPPDRNPESDSKPGHLVSSFSAPLMRPLDDEQVST